MIFIHVGSLRPERVVKQTSQTYLTQQCRWQLSMLWGKEVPSRSSSGLQQELRQAGIFRGARVTLCTADKGL